MRDKTFSLIKLQVVINWPHEPTSTRLVRTGRGGLWLNEGLMVYYCHSSFQPLSFTCHQNISRYTLAWCVMVHELICLRRQVTLECFFFLQKVSSLRREHAAAKFRNPTVFLLSVFLAKVNRLKRIWCVLADAAWRRRNPFRRSDTVSFCHACTITGTIFSLNQSWKRGGQVTESTSVSTHFTKH